MLPTARGARIPTLSWQKNRYTSRNVTDADHAEPKRTRNTPGQRCGRVSGTHKVLAPTVQGQRSLTQSAAAARYAE